MKRGKWSRKGCLEWFVASMAHLHGWKTSSETWERILSVKGRTRTSIFLYTKADIQLLPGRFSQVALLESLCHALRTTHFMIVHDQKYSSQPNVKGFPHLDPSHHIILGDAGLEKQIAQQ